MIKIDDKKKRKKKKKKKEKEGKEKKIMCTTPRANFDAFLLFDKFASRKF